LNGSVTIHVFEEITEISKRLISNPPHTDAIQNDKNGIAILPYLPNRVPNKTIQNYFRVV